MQDFRCYYVSGASILSATFVHAQNEDHALLLARLIYQDKLQPVGADALEIWYGAEMVLTASLTDVAAPNRP